MEIMIEKNKNMSKYDIIQVIFKCCVSQMYLVVLLSNYKHMYDWIDMIKK